MRSVAPIAALGLAFLGGCFVLYDYEGYELDPFPIEWAKRFPSNGDETVTALAVSNHHVVIAGGFQGRIDLGPLTLDAPAGGNFIARFDLRGNVESLQGLPFELPSSVRAMAFAENGDLYLTGNQYTGGPQQGYLARIVAGGTTIEPLTQFGGLEDDAGVSVATFGGAAFVLGKIRGAPMLTCANFTDQISDMDEDFFLFAFENAACTWAHRLTTGFHEPTDMAFDGDGNVITTGTYTGLMYPFSLPYAPAPSGFIIATRRDNGEPVWTQWISATPAGAVFPEATASAGDIVLVTGSLKGGAHFGAAPNDCSDVVETADPDDEDGFVVAWDTARQGKCLWVRHIAGGGQQRGLDVATDEKGTVYVSGFATGRASLDSTPPFELPGSGERLFVVALDLQGKPLWGRAYGSTTEPQFGGGTLRLGPIPGKGLAMAGTWKSPLLFGHATPSALEGLNHDLFVAWNPR
jgi:hypothetical protein